MNLELLNATQEEYRKMSKEQLLDVINAYIEDNDELLERWQNRLERVRDLKEEITHLKNLIVTMSYDIYYEDGSIMDTSIRNVRESK